MFLARRSENAAYIEDAFLDQGMLIAPSLLEPDYIDEYVTLRLADTCVLEQTESQFVASVRPPAEAEVDIPDLLGTLFDFVSDSEASAFRQDFDSANMMALFVIPKDKQIYPLQVILDLLRRSFANKARALSNQTSADHLEVSYVINPDEPIFRFQAGHCVLQKHAVSALLNDHDGKNVLFNSNLNP